MRQELVDHFGQVWYVDSDKPVSVKPCPACGRPLEVVSLVATPKINQVVFRDSKGKTSGIFDTEQFGKAGPVTCHFCEATT